MGAGVYLLIVGTWGHGSQLLSGYMGAGVQLLTVGTWGQGGPAAYSGYMGAGGSSCLQWVHGGKGSSCLQWVHGGKGSSCLQRVHGGKGASCLQWVHGGKGAWVHEGGGLAAYSWYMRVGICGARVQLLTVQRRIQGGGFGGCNPPFHIW